MKPQPRNKHGQIRKLEFTGVFARAGFPGEPSGQHKKADVVSRKKNHAAATANSIVEPEAGRTVNRK